MPGLPFVLLIGSSFVAGAPASANGVSGVAPHAPLALRLPPDAGAPSPAGHELTKRPSEASMRTRLTFTSEGTRFDWKPVHDAIEGTLWRDALSPSAVAADGPFTTRLPGEFHGTGFPLLERVVRLPEHRRRRWEPLISWSEPADSLEGAAVPLPHVRCMGLSPHAVARRAARVEGTVLELSIEHGVSASLVKALIAAESCFDHEAVSSAGAIGLMQLMPATAEWLGAGDPADVTENLRGGIRYLASLQERFGDTELALAAYNAGPGNVHRHGGVPPFAETRAYVRKVMAFHRRYVAATEMAAR